MKDRLEELVADEPLALIDHYRIVRGALCTTFIRSEPVQGVKSFSALLPEVLGWYGDFDHNDYFVCAARFDGRPRRSATR